MIRTRSALRRAHEAALRLCIPASGTRRERGDVPGWVLITLMTAGLVAALWAVAEDQLVALFSRALASVTG